MKRLHLFNERLVGHLLAARLIENMVTPNHRVVDVRFGLIDSTLRRVIVTRRSGFKGTRSDMGQVFGRPFMVIVTDACGRCYNTSLIAQSPGGFNSKGV